MALTITHPIVNLVPGVIIKSRNELTYSCAINLAPSEFSPLYASCDEPGPSEFLFSLRTPTPIAHMHVPIFHNEP